MANLLGIILLFLVSSLVIAAAVILGIKVIQAIGIVVSRIATWIARTVTDVFGLVGSLLLSIVFIPLSIGNVVLGRWSAASHFGKAIGDELRSAGLAAYRIFLGHPAWLLGLTKLTEGIEHRLPRVIAEAPGSDKPSKRQAAYEGYTIVGSLAGGGSGGKLYIAEPDEAKAAALARQGHPGVGQVVIKSFALADGSSLPQIVRESRALDAAKKLGLVLEHDLNPQRFYYVMRYVPGDSLAAVTGRLHADAGPEGLDRDATRAALTYTADLLRALDRYHQGGLWHKDVKPDNIIIEPAHGGSPARATLVDFGLVTPLRSAMTLTTHGTEYFRDPELVRQALRGAKVHEIDGARFDLYAAGAVLFSVLENSFPAHGGLSRMEKRCPEAIRWVVRRAMTDYDKRYPTARAMLEDIEAVLAASDPYMVTASSLPSVRSAAEHADEGGAAPMVPVTETDVARDETPAAPRPRPTPPPPPSVAVAASVPPPPPGFGTAVPPPPPAVARAQTPRVPAGSRRPAQEQLKTARARASARRARAESVIAARLGRRPRKPGTVNAGMLFALMFVPAVVLGLIFGVMTRQQSVPAVSIAVPSIAIDGDDRVVIHDLDTLPQQAFLGQISMAIEEALRDVGEVSWHELKHLKAQTELTITTDGEIDITADQLRAQIRSYDIEDARDAIENIHERVQAVLEQAGISEHGVAYLNAAENDNPSVTPDRWLIRDGRAATVLLASSLVEPVDPRVAAVLSGELVELREAGGTVRGGLTAGAADDEDTIELVAEALSRRGRVSKLDAKGASLDELTGFVDDEDEIDILVLVEPGAPGRAPRVGIITSEAASVEELSDRLDARLRSVSLIGW